MVRRDAKEGSPALKRSRNSNEMHFVLPSHQNDVDDGEEDQPEERRHAEGLVDGIGPRGKLAIEGLDVIKEFCQEDIDRDRLKVFFEKSKTSVATGATTIHSMET